MENRTNHGNGYADLRSDQHFEVSPGVFAWTGRTLLCQMRANYGSGEGDSGALVVSVNPDGTVALRGINWGRVAGGESNFSRAWSAYTEFQGIGISHCMSQSCAPQPPSTPTVEISEPAEVPPGQYCTWWAQVSNGTPPYAYQWSGILSGIESQVSGEVWQSGWLWLDVTDATGYTTGDQRYVTVSEFAPSCQI